MLRGTVEMEMLRHPHLVLPDVASNDGIIAGAIRKNLQKPGRINFRAWRGVIPCVRFFRGSALAAPRFDFGQLASQRFQSMTQVADHWNIGAPKFADLRAVHVKMNYFGVRRESVQPPGRPVIESRADANQQIASLYRVVRG